ncbi:MAG: hypothetical protein KF690_06170 [Bacteroidetes bacterium]|nr:hypothetical protein [Bacteroidota bacterium]
MPAIHLILLLLITGLAAPYTLYAQGDSDAGVASLPGLATNRPDEEDHKLHLRLEYAYGGAEHQVKVHTTALRAALNLGKSWQLEAYLPFVATSGELGSLSGLGDPVLSARLRVATRQEWRFYLSGGLRIPGNDANKTFPLANSTVSHYSAPMPYQTSLGTLDVLGGASAVLPNKWLFALGAQYAHDWNNNSFLARAPIPEDHPARKYADSNQLRRKPDVMFRAERLLGIRDNGCVFGIGLLGILKIMEDQVYYPNTPEFSRANFTPVAGSTGLTLNANLSARFRLAPGLYLTLLGAKPLVTREKRPDGLARDLVLHTALGVLF